MHVLTLMPLAGPLLFAAVALIAGRSQARAVYGLALAAALVNVALAFGAVALVAFAGPATSPVLGAGSMGVSLRLDSLSVALFTLVAFVGVVVIRFSRNYLDGDPRHGYFLANLGLTLGAVTMLVLAGNLVQLVLAWVATSLALHRLLMFYPERPRAVVAARKKFLFARLGDGCLGAAAVLLGLHFGTADIAAILEQARAMAGNVDLTLAAVLIVTAAMLKSAQFPFHGWLVEVMETPTPVSALLHAGIINAGGFLVIRFADVVVLSPGVLHVLAVVGGFTALFGAVVMLTQTSVKVALAWSTVSQMGFMLLQCGLGAFAPALLHIVAHSLYKAHAFLASGSAIDAARVGWAAGDAPRPQRLHFAGALAAAALGFTALGALFGVSPAEKPAIVTLGAVIVLGLSLFLTRSLAGQPPKTVMVRSGAAAATVAAAYFALQGATAHLLGDAVPAAPALTGVGVAVMAGVMFGFSYLVYTQLFGIPRGSGFYRAAYVHLSNGLYVNALLNRMLGAIRSDSTIRA